MDDQNSKTSIAEQKTKRSSIKGQLTKFTNYLNSLNVDEPISELKFNELTLKLNRMVELSAKFDELQTLIEISNPTELESELSERERLEDSFHLSIATAQCILDKAAAAKLKPVSSGAACSGNCHHSEHMGFQLPQIRISKFDGSYYKWMEFRDTFESLIHSNDRIRAVHKFHYLNSYLEGEASRVISNLEVSESNYSEAWNILCERYNNKRQLVTNHLNSLLNVDLMQRESDKSLRFLSDNITKNLRALKTLGLPTEHWDALLIHLFANKLDSSTSAKWEEYRGDLSDSPTLDDFRKFLKNRADVLETLLRSKKDKDKNSFNKNETTNNKGPLRQDKNINTFVVSAKQNNSKGRPCVACGGDHRVYDCALFRHLTVDERWAQVSKLRLCQVCLRTDHESRHCKLNGCRVCKKRHNTFLHKEQTQNTNTSNPQASSASMEPGTPSTSAATQAPLTPGENTSTVSTSALSSSEVLLSTALIEIFNPCNNRKETVRALLDCGSQSSYISEDLKSRLELPSLPLTATTILGIGNTELKCVPGRCTAQIKSLSDSYTAKLDFLVLKEITDSLPRNYVDASQLKIPSSMRLADPTFNIPSQVQVLLGADIFWNLVGGEQMPLANKRARLVNSKLGWVIAGSVVSTDCATKKKTTRSNFSLTEISNQMTKFWEAEELPSTLNSKDSPSAKQPIEEHFINNTYRLDNGRFVVRLPLTDTSDCLGNSFYMAKRRLLNLEKRFHKQPELRNMYSEFINEYKQLEHLSESQASPSPHFNNYLPHHPIVKEQSESTKLRVVFDASCPTSSGYSVNDIQMVGPCIQDSLFNILLRFRHYRYVLSGDIEKQYRQILVNELDRHLQTILWREDDHLPIRSLTLNTVTYGFASASFLAARCLWQLGDECNDPRVKAIIQRDFYCDDLLTGADTESDLLYIQAAVSKALSAGCFNLRKYRSNSSELLNSKTINAQDDLALSQSCQTLGLGWNPGQDTLHFSIDAANKEEKMATKRSILSATFKIFDPLGLLSLCTVKPKLLIQKLWEAKLGWDDPAPPEIQRIWSRFIKNLHHLGELSIPRNVLIDQPYTIELHCFSDASQSAFAACIYVKSVSSSGEQHINLLCAKDRLGPIRPISIPRMELCGALLAAQTWSAVVTALRKPISRTFFWTDSSVVLAWLKTPPCKLNIFVRNRVTAVLDLTSASSWRHVPTTQNPADLASRGVDPQHVAKTALWWHGPEFLLEPETNWPTLEKSPPQNLPELKVTTMLVHENKDLPQNCVIKFDNYSRLKTLQRVVAFMRRFLNNCKNNNPKLTGPLTAQELKDSFHTLVKLSQAQTYSSEIETLHKNKYLNTKSPMAPLTPFIDSQGILRVGGRLDASQYHYDKKHPIVLSSKHTLTKLIFEQEHTRLLHAGPQLLLASVRDSIWPVGGRNLARRTAHNCVTCRRATGKTLENIMGNLPSQRLTPDFPFTAAAVDFAGPYLITDRRGRGCKITKCYLCLFICLKYKCMHLEAVSELSKDAFVLALKRFIARRGKPKDIWCDNGRNFVAAAKEIAQFVKLNKINIKEFAADEGINFIFSPAYAPNYNGLAEAGIKRAKFHLKRILGNTHLTFEELASVFSQIEAILNSRPLCPLSPSPNDFSPLTPGHFLVGRPLTSLPSPPLHDANPNKLDRYRRLEQIRQHFWSRWSTEYVAELQQRYKWRARHRDLQLDELVLIKDESLRPLHWRMGRVSKLFPGPDGVPRVADIATAQGTIRRALNRICPLPSSQDS